MTSSHEQPLSKEELLARFLGNALEHDAEDIAFWRAAGDELRGETLYRLLVQGRAITSTVPNAIAAQEDRMRLVLAPHSVTILTDYE